MQNKSRLNKVYLLSLGCPRNLWDSEKIAYSLKRKGFILSPSLEDADMAILNTCCFIKEAKEESLDYIETFLDLKKKGSLKKVLIMGCLVRRYRHELIRCFPQIDALLDIYFPFGRVHYRSQFLFRRFYSYLKLAEGCSNLCSYCAIPLIRGSLRSRRLGEIIQEAEFLDKKGIKELILVAQDTTSWGKDLSKEMDLSYLIKRILKKTKIPWIRILYTHPLHIRDSLLELIKREERICKYLDLPFQHVNDRILKLMRRGISKAKIINLIERIREKIPSLFLRTTFIVGFPGEREEEFQELLSFIKKYPFERLGCFIYSPEEKTPASNFKNQIHPKTKERRYRVLMETQRIISSEIQRSLEGKILNILIEERKDSYYIGRSQYDAPDIDGLVYLKGKRRVLGKIVEAKITNSFEYDLEGEII